MEPLTITAVTIILLCIVIIKVRSKPKISLPAPWGIPIIGHVLFLGKNPAKRMLQWKQNYGPVFQLNLLGKRVIVLNDRRSIAECFSREEFCGRKNSVPIGDWWIKCARLGILMNEGPQVDELRSFFLKSFREYGMHKSKLDSSVQEELNELRSRWRGGVGVYFDLSGEFSQLVLNCAWRVLANKSYNYEETQPLFQYTATLTQANDAASGLSVFVPWLVNKFSNVVQEKMDAHIAVTKLQEELVEERNRSRIPGEPRDVLDKFLDKVEATTNPDSIFHASRKSIGAAFRDLLYATLDTLSLTLEWFIVYSGTNSDVVCKLQQEIDHVLGRDTLPSIADKERMPYAMACVLETLRKSSVAPLALPHRTVRDTFFRGSPVPEGTLVFGNIYGVHHDEEVWENPQEFRPERFLNHSGALSQEAASKLLPFGAGKRSCIGFSVVYDEIFLVITSIYQEFSIKLQGSGNLLEGEFGLTCRPRSGIKILARPRWN